MRIDTVRAYLPFPSLLIQLDGDVQIIRVHSLCLVCLCLKCVLATNNSFPLFISRIVRPFHLEYIIINQVKEKKMKPAVCESGQNLSYK